MGGKWARTIFFEMGGTSPMGVILSFDNLESKPPAVQVSQQDPGLCRKYVSEDYNVSFFDNRARASLSKVVAKW